MRENQRSYDFKKRYYFERLGGEPLSEKNVFEATWSQLIQILKIPP